jgi:hypothetical protein
MVIYFISALLISAVLFKLGSYAMLISLMITTTKMVVILALIIGAFLLYKRWIGNGRLCKLMGLL